MQEVIIKLCRVTELNEKAKEQAIEAFRDLNVNSGWWQYTYEDFKEICATIGIEVDTEDIYFSGFYSQGDGCKFFATINVAKLVKAIQEEAWKTYAPKEELQLSPVNINSRILKLFEKEMIDNPKIVYTVKGYGVAIDQPCDFQRNRKTNFANIDWRLDDLTEQLMEVAKTLNNFLYRRLENEYEYLSSDEGVLETIKANDYVFTEDGKKADYLIALAQPKI